MGSQSRIPGHTGMHSAKQANPRDGHIVAGARQLLRGRQEIIALGPRGLFRDSAWDMLLELFIAQAEGHVVYTKHIMLVSGDSPAAAIRRIERLQSAQFIERLGDPLDQRRVIVRLTSRGYKAVSAMLTQIFEADLPADTDKYHVKDPNDAAGIFF